MGNWLIPLFSILFTVAFYPLLMIYLALLFGLGSFTWLLFALLLSPFVALSVKVQYEAFKRWRLSIIDYRQRDREIVLAEYLATVKKKEDR